MRRLLVGVTFMGMMSGGLLSGISAATAGPPPVPVFSWSGCYLGGHVGGAWRQMDSTPTVNFNALAPLANIIFLVPGTFHDSGPGLLGGGQVGCNYQFAPNWVVGVEGEFSGTAFKLNDAGQLSGSVAGFSVTDTGTFDAKTEWIAAGTARLGYAVDRWLVYAKGGPAWVRNRFDYHGQEYVCGGGACGDPRPLTANASDTRLGWTVGAGVEWAFWDRWSAKLEYDFYDFGSHQVIFNSTRGPNSAIPTSDVAPTAFTVDQKIHTVKLGLNFRFW